MIYCEKHVTKAGTGNFPQVTASIAQKPQAFLKPLCYDVPIEMVGYKKQPL